MAKTRTNLRSAAQDVEATALTSLGGYLSQVREIRKLTLREVEQATENKVSNAYLSQLEKGRISKPSPNVLHALAHVYNVAYDTLMEKAGYVVAATTTDVLRAGKGGGAKATKNALSNEELSKDEEAKLMEYLAFLRRR